MTPDDKMPKVRTVKAHLQQLLSDTLKATPRLGEFGPRHRIFVHGYRDDSLIVTVQGDDVTAEPALKVAIRIDVEETT